MISVRRALVLSFAERYLLVALALAGVVTIARLLTPNELGIYSVSLAVIGIAQVLRDFGIGNFLIQETNLTEDHIRTAFGLSLLLGAFLSVLVYLGAPWVGSIYAEPQLVETLRIGALNLLVMPIGAISMALLRRNMAFDRLLVVNVVAAAMGFASTIAFALGGHGPNSMAIGSVVASAVTGIGSWLALSPRRLLLPSFSQWRVFLHFGVQSSVASVVTTISMDINDLTLGKILGFTPLAIISRAQGLMNLFHREVLGAVRNVALPAFAKAHREGEALESRHIAAVTNLTVIAWPFYGFLALFSLEILRIMFGTQWDAAAGLVPYFALAGALAATASLITTVMLAVGRIDLVVKSELIFQPIRAVLIVAAALIFGTLQSCATAYLLFFSAYAPCMYAIKGRCVPNDVAAQVRHLWVSFKVSILSLIFPASIAFYAGWGRNQPLSVVTVITAAALLLVGWFVALRWCRHPLVTDPLFRRLTTLLHRFV